MSALEDFLRGLFGGRDVSLSVSADLGSGYDALSEEDRQRAKICAHMRSRIGTKYKLGAEIQPGQENTAPETDCSEEVEAAYRVAGLTIPDGSPYQFNACVPIKVPKPGDLGFLWSDKWGRIGHVMVYMGSGYVIHAVGNRGVVEDPVARWLESSRWKGWRRFRPFLCPPEDAP